MPQITSISLTKGDEVRKHREDLGISKTQLAAFIGVSVQTVTNAERGFVVRPSYYANVLHLTRPDIDGGVRSAPRVADPEDLIAIGGNDLIRLGDLHALHTRIVADLAALYRLAKQGATAPTQRRPGSGPYQPMTGDQIARRKVEARETVERLRAEKRVADIAEAKQLSERWNEHAMYGRNGHIQAEIAALKASTKYDLNPRLRASIEFFEQRGIPALPTNPHCRNIFE